MNKYVIQKNRDTTQRAGTVCHEIVIGDGLVDTDCTVCSGAIQHARYTKPVWEVGPKLEVLNDTGTQYEFEDYGLRDYADCFALRTQAQAECDTRNAA